MSRVFEAMRRLSTATPETTQVPEILETFVVETVRPSLDIEDEPFPVQPATQWADSVLPPANPAAKRGAREGKSEKLARSFGDLLRDIARDEQEDGF